MKVRHFWVGGLAAVVSAALITLLIAIRCDAPRASDDSRRPIVVGKSAAPHAAARANVAPAATSVEDRSKPAPLGAASSSESYALDDLPTIADLDRKYPGIYKGYQDALSEFRSSSLLRMQRRCLRSHALDMEIVDWAAVQTFTVDATGQAQLSGLELVPSKPGMQPFLDCISHEQIGKVAFRAPEGTPATLVVREDNRIIQTTLTAEDVAQRVATLTTQLAATNLSPGQRTLLEQQLALYQCYAQRGLAHREQCDNDLEHD